MRANALFSKRAVIASGAKQSISPSEERVDCFVASLLAMTSPQFKHDFAFLRRDAPEVLPGIAALEIRGRGECRVPSAPAAARVV